MTSPSNAAPAVAASPYIKDVTVQNFMQEVIQASLQVPVLVYFTPPGAGHANNTDRCLRKW